jgi:toxin ParE1/3/4
MSDLSPLCAPKRTSAVHSKFMGSPESPLAGRERPELRSDLRSFPVDNYIIFCMPLPDGVEIVRVMNGRQDIDADDMA